MKATRFQIERLLEDMFLASGGVCGGDIETRSFRISLGKSWTHPPTITSLTGQWNGARTVHQMNQETTVLVLRELFAMVVGEQRTNTEKEDA